MGGFLIFSQVPVILMCVCVRTLEFVCIHKHFFIRIQVCLFNLYLAGCMYKCPCMCVLVLKTENMCVNSRCKLINHCGLSSKLFGDISFDAISDGNFRRFSLNLPICKRVELKRYSKQFIYSLPKIVI